MVSDLTVLFDVTTGTNTIYVMTNSTDGQRKPPNPTHQPKDIKLTISLSLPPKDNPLPIPPGEDGD